MYLEMFGLREYPFRLTPDSDFLFLSQGHARAKAYMDFAVWSRDGFVVITGDVGTGKTTLIRRLLSEFGENILVAKVFQTQLDEVELLQAILVEFGLNPFNAHKVELLDMLNNFLIERFIEVKQLVLIVDDAHNLSLRALEEIRMLSSLETNKEKLLHIILVGQPALSDKLDTPELEQLMQRVRIRYHLRPLSPEDTRAYVLHRLGAAGAGDREIFAAATHPLIYEYTGGVPRLVNTLCDTALTVAFADGATAVSEPVMREAIGELGWRPFAERTLEAQRVRVAGGNMADVAGVPGTEGDLQAAIARLAGLENTLGPSLGQMASSLANIELLLHQIKETLEAREAEGGANAKAKSASPRGLR